MTNNDLIKTAIAVLIVLTFPLIIICLDMYYQTSELPSENSDEVYHSFKEANVQIFPQYSFSVKCPVVLKDVSEQSNDDFEFNYAGNTKDTFYQIMIIRLPASLDDTAIRKMMSNQGGGKFTEFGEERLLAYQPKDYTQNGNTGRGITVVRNGLMYVFNVMTKADLSSEYSNFINSVSFTGELFVKTVGQYKEYEKQGYGAFSILYPHDWELIEDPNQYVSLFVRSKKEGQSQLEANFNIIISSNRNSLEDMFNTTQKQLRENIPEYDLLTKEYIKVAGMDCIRTEANARMQGIFIRSLGYQLKKKDDTLYTITFIVEENRFKQYNEVFKNIINSFKTISL